MIEGAELSGSIDNQFLIPGQFEKKSSVPNTTLLLPYSTRIVMPGSVLRLKRKENQDPKKKKKKKRMRKFACCCRL